MTLTETLPSTRSAKHRAINWTPCPAESRCPCTGTLAITTSKKHEEYGVVEIIPSPHYEPGRAFQMVKPDGEVYSLLLADRRDRSECDCAGFSYDATRKADYRHQSRTDSLGCKHLDAIAAVIANGWLPHPQANPDQDVTSTEIE
jgi:hypothetical protein